jgi:hypothetical protein
MKLLQTRQTILLNKIQLSAYKTATFEVAVSLCVSRETILNYSKQSE